MKPNISRFSRIGLKIHTKPPMTYKETAFKEIYTLGGLVCNHDAPGPLDILYVILSVLKGGAGRVVHTRL